MISRMAIRVAGAVTLWTASAHADEAACVAGRERAAGQYAACQSQARATGAVVGLTKCRIRYGESWAKLKARPPGTSCVPATRFADGGDGTVFTVFLSAMNNGGGSAGANDWRLPTIQELPTIVLPEAYPCVTFPCTVPELGPDSSSGYWSAHPCALPDGRVARQHVLRVSEPLRPKTSDLLVRAGY